MVSAGPLLCALLAVLRLAISTVGGCIGAETRVRGIDLALSTVIRGVEAASCGTHPGIGYAYDETASDRANQYNGRVFDPGTGFHDYGARMYWPQIGRFISADSYAGDIGNPASLNRYSYVLNNPYRYSDPTGHQAEEGPEERMGEAGSEDIGAQFRYARQNAAIERIEKTGTRVTTMRAQGEAPSDEAVTQLERLADEVDPPKTDALPSLRTPRIPAKQIRAIWEKANPGKTWPFDDEMGRNQDAAHIKSLADGGTNDPSNVKPQPHGEHMEEHSKNGDFARWGRRATETRAKDEK